jgi:hypothetical protein
MIHVSNLKCQLKNVNLKCKKMERNLLLELILNVLYLCLLWTSILNVHEINLFVIKKKFLGKIFRGDFWNVLKYIKLLEI